MTSLLKKVISIYHHKKCIFICALYFYSPLLSKCGILNTTAVQQIYRHLRYKSKNGHKAVTASCATTFFNTTDLLVWYIYSSNEERHTPSTASGGTTLHFFQGGGYVFLKVLCIESWKCWFLYEYHKMNIDQFYKSFKKNLCLISCHKLGI